MTEISAFFGLIFVVACAVAVIVAIVSGWFLKKVIHAPLKADPGIIIVSVIVAVICIVAFQFTEIDPTHITESEIVPFVQTLIILTVTVIGYVVGHMIGPPESTVRLWTRDKDAKGKIVEVSFFIKDKIAYLPPKNMRQSLAAMKGTRGVFDMDLSRPYFTTELEIDTKDVDETIKEIIPLAKSTPSSVKVGFIKFGKKKVKAEDGTVTKVQRYLLSTTVESQKHVPADRVYQRFDEFWFDITSTKKATADAASVRAQMDRLELTMEERFYEEVVAHHRRMVSFDIDNSQLPRELEEGVIAEIERRKAAKEGKTEAPV